MICHDCKAEEGYLHTPGCDMEKCPKCGDQIISCECDNSKLSDKERIPWICYPNMCSRCGKLWPALFLLPDEEWKKYVEPEQRKSVLCFDCYQHIKEAIDICFYETKSGTPFLHGQVVQQIEAGQYEPL